MEFKYSFIIDTQGIKFTGRLISFKSTIPKLQYSIAAKINDINSSQPAIYRTKPDLTAPGN